MSEVLLNTLYISQPKTVVSKSKETLKVTYTEDEVQKTFQIPIHNIKSICIFGNTRITPYVLKLCLDHQVSIHFHTENGFLLGHIFGSGDTRYLVRKAQYATSDDPVAAQSIAKMLVAGKIQNSRINLLRSRRESESETEQKQLSKAIRSLAELLKKLERQKKANTLEKALGPIRGIEGMAAKTYFQVFSNMMKQQREYFLFTTRSRRPPLDRINCLLSFLYALTRSDCLTALSVAGIDPYVGWLHTTRAGRPACALDLMEEFRPLAERLAITLINRKQIQKKHFKELEGGSVELTRSGRNAVITAWQKRKKIMVKHELFQQKMYMGHVYLIQAQQLSRWLRKETSHYVPFISN
ncbi:MAG: CRISPR-associated endonuclease Cas1 [Proteobacteria bacterium]|nr:CRISPR-associated endonuclease Cas1 [Pseudomonadota bacterium]